MKPSEILAKAADLIAPEGAWTQRAYARDVRGSNVASNSKHAVCWCAIGSINRVTGGTGNRANEAARRYLGDAIPGGAVMFFNDAEGRTQAEVVAALRKAAQLAREPERVPA